MKCSKCGADIHPGAAFCTNCGSPIQTPQQAAPVQRPRQTIPAPAPAQAQPAPAAPKKKSHAALWIALGALLVTAGIAVAFILGGVLGDRSSDDDDDAIYSQEDSSKPSGEAVPYNNDPAGVLLRAYQDVMPGYSSEDSETLYLAGDEDFASVHDKIEPAGETITKLVKTPGGYVAETEFSGAQGMITMVIGLDNDLKCSGIYVTKHCETAGLGARAAETEKGAWRDNLLGQGDGLKLQQDGGEVNAISGATITSNAVINEVQIVIDAVKALG